MEQWYEKLFENYGAQYEKENFVHGTIGECDFIEIEINRNKQIRILDIGCGTGRHDIELAKRGYSVTGIDLSESLLRRAKEKAVILGLEINFLKHDARNLPFENEFDLVMMICEGAFPLMETDEMNFLILHNAEKALTSGGKLIFTTLNGLFPLFHSVRDFLASEKKEGNATYDQNSFDLMTFRDYNVTTVTDDSGKDIELRCNERYYVPSEITWLLKSLGFSTISIYGAKLGAFSRTDKLTTEDFEMLVIAEK
jgi:2-polyprenyl-3-methyl-5-hydroxy-6-metoxy-1,4-benzoquinol methylase